MQNKILTEQSNPNTTNIDISTTLQIIEMINEEDKKVALAVEKQNANIAEAVDLIAENFLKGGSLIYFGAGTSGRLGVLDASECPPTFGVDADMVRGYIAGGDFALRNAIEGAEDDFEAGKEDLLKYSLNKNDVIVGISASGNPKYLLGVLETAKTEGKITIGVTSNPNAKIKEHTDVFIAAEVGNEPITGSTRMKSGTAQKLILNMLTTASMVKIGKTYKNYMVDLKPTNEKLKVRACQIVSEIAECDFETAQKMLIQNCWDVKTSILMIKKGLSKENAELMLSKNSGILRKCL